MQQVLRFISAAQPSRGSSRADECSFVQRATSCVSFSQSLRQRAASSLLISLCSSLPLPMSEICPCSTTAVERPYCCSEPPVAFLNRSCYSARDTACSRIPMSVLNLKSQTTYHYSRHGAATASLEQKRVDRSYAVNSLADAPKGKTGWNRVPSTREECPPRLLGVASCKNVVQEGIILVHDARRFGVSERGLWHLNRLHSRVIQPRIRWGKDESWPVKPQVCGKPTCRFERSTVDHPPHLAVKLALLRPDLVTRLLRPGLSMPPVQSKYLCPIQSSRCSLMPT